MLLPDFSRSPPRQAAGGGQHQRRPRPSHLSGELHFASKSV